MKRYFLILTLFAVLALSVSGQTPSATPPDEDIVKITTTLIQVDVTVTDKHGKPIADLKPEEVEIYENGRKQAITNFSFVNSVRPEIPEAKSDDLRVPLPETRRKVDPADVRRTIALVVDDLTLSFESTHYVRLALRKFVNEQMAQGDLVAIVRTGGGIGALQQFTTNKAQLLAAIDRIRWNMTGLGEVGAFAPIVPDLSSDMPNLSASTRDPNSDPRNPSIISSDENSDTKASRESIEELREDVFVSGTLGAVRYLARGMRELPGRKSVMLFSDGFRLTRPNSDGSLENSRILNQLRLLIDACNRANVVVYTMDARGLQPAGFTAQDNLTFLNPTDIENRLTERLNKLFDTQDGLIYIARETGGIPYLNSNDLAGGIEKMLNDQSYYLVGYEPDDETFDPQKAKFNKLEVKVKRPGAKVRYRSGFFGVAEEGEARPLAGAKGEQRLLYALSSPFTVNELQLDLHTVFKGEKKKEMTLDAFLHIDVGGLEIRKDEKGSRTATFDVLIMNFGDNGVPTGALSKTFTIDVEKTDYDKLMAEGLVYTVTFPVKKPGPYQIRAAVRDRNTEKIGSSSEFVMVPDVGKKRLTLSGIVVNNITYEMWNRTAGEGGVRFDKAGTEQSRDADPFNDTALRRFRGGTVLTFAFEAYNVRAVKPGELRLKTRLIKDGKVFFNGKESPVDLTAARDGQTVSLQGAINLAKGMELGDYALQVIVTDAASKKEKYSVASQFLQFEMVD